MSLDYFVNKQEIDELCRLEYIIDNADVFAQWILEDFNYKKQTVMMAPATGFYNTKGLGKNEVRIAYALKIEDLKNAVITLKHALEAYPGRVL